MSDIFFNELEIPRPNIQLDVNGGGHGEMTGKMLIEIEKALLVHRPDIVLVYGDTNSTLAGALAAVKLHIPVAHVEAGLRSFNMKMPEEINRIMTDHISSILFCPTDTAILNLRNEGIVDKEVKVIRSGDVMKDASILFSSKARLPSCKLAEEFILATIHREENTNNIVRLSSIVSALNDLHENVCPVVLPIHPRTKKIIKDSGLDLRVITIDPVGYLEMIGLIQKCQIVLTDSGGLQKEAYFFGKFCLTMREQTEWVELIDEKVNLLVGADSEKIYRLAKDNMSKKIVTRSGLYGEGNASEYIVNELIKFNL